MTTRTMETTIEIGDGGECEMAVSYEWTPYDPGVSIGPVEGSYPPEGGVEKICCIEMRLRERNPHGSTCRPGEPGWVQVEPSVLGDDQLARLMERCHEHAEMQDDDD